MTSPMWSRGNSTCLDSPTLKPAPLLSFAVYIYPSSCGQDDLAHILMSDEHLHTLAPRLSYGSLVWKVFVGAGGLLVWCFHGRQLWLTVPELWSCFQRRRVMVFSLQYYYACFNCNYRAK